VVIVSDENNRVVYQKHLPDEFARIAAALEPCQHDFLTRTLSRVGTEMSPRYRPINLKRIMNTLLPPMPAARAENWCSSPRCWLAAFSAGAIRPGVNASGSK
jgi:hypothetical protein